MSTHPYIPLYVDDYEAATAHLTAEEDGVYMRLLRLAWRTPGCSLPTDHAALARKIRLSQEDFQRVAVPVLGEFFRVSRGRYVQRRLRDEYENISRKKSARVAAGKKGGDAKARKTHEKSASIASVLPAHARAFPEPEPYIVEDKSSTPADPVGAKAWTDAVQLLTARGNMGERQARAFFGRLLSQHGLEARELVGPLAVCAANGTTDPAGYLTGAAKGVGKRQQPQKRVGFV